MAIIMRAARAILPAILRVGLAAIYGFAGNNGATPFATMTR